MDTVIPDSTCPPHHFLIYVLAIDGSVENIATGIALYEVGNPFGYADTI